MEYFAESDYYDQDLVDECKAIAEISKIPEAVILTMNFLYEMSAHCTSIVLENSDRQMIFARNLDFAFTNYIAGLTVEGHFYRNGKLVYIGNMIVGYGGILTGVKPGKFSLSINERDTHSPIDLLRNLDEMFERRSFDDIKWARKVLETAESFDEAKTMLAT